MVEDVPVWSGSERCDRHLFRPCFAREAGPTWIRSAGTEFSIREVLTIRITRATCIDAHFEQHSFVRNGTTSWGIRAGACVCATSCRPFRRVASFVRLSPFVSDPLRSTSTRWCERGASRTTSAWTRACASSCGIRPSWTEKGDRSGSTVGGDGNPVPFRTRISFGSNPRSSPINLRSRNPIRPIRFEGLPARSPTSPPLPSRVSNPSFHPERSFCDASYLRREGCGRHRIAGRDGPRGNEREREGERHTERGVRAYRRSIVVGPSVSGPQFAPPEQRARIYVLRIVRAKQLVCERDGRWPTGSTR